MVRWMDSKANGTTDGQMDKTHFAMESVFASGSQPFETHFETW